MDAPYRDVTVYTIGHSTHPLDELVALLRHHGIARVVDIRSLPRSARNPQFDGRALTRDLPAQGIAYVHEPRLGGFRTARPTSVNTGLTHPGFRAYADHMASDEFAAALDELVRTAAEAPTTVMCAEGSPFRCHRRLLADALTARGARVLHITSRAAPRAHRLSELAVWDGSRLTYPPGPPGQEALDLFS
jgi:uncharacterized protein (DUF488 family)